MRHSGLLRYVLLLNLICLGTVNAQPVQPGEPIDYQPMEPEAWKKKGTSTRLYPWEGKQVVLLTIKKELDPEIMGLFLKRLDAGWEFYAKTMPRVPNPFRLHNGKVVIALVPDASYTCGMGCGFIGATGIEIAGFYRDHFGGPGDYTRIKRDRAVFQHYYFYEMGRNWYQFEGRHSPFVTGFAVFMRNVCMDLINAKDEDIATRRAIERAEDIYARSSETFNETFIGHLGRQGNKLLDKNGKPINLTDVNCMYASVMLKLRKSYGGDEWVKKFYHFLMDCPEGGGVKLQTWNWLISASCAAGQDLTPLFVNRWRCPIPAKVQQALAAVNWKAMDLSPRKIMLSLPVEELPPVLSVTLPSFLTDSMKNQNMLADASFEDDGKDLWKKSSFLNNRKAIDIVTDAAQHGKKSLHMTANHPDDMIFKQKVPVKAKTAYVLCGWVKTKDVVVKEKGGNMGANLSIEGANWKSQSITGTTDWTYVGFIFNSDTRTEINVCARLGYTGSTSTGEAWFDNLYLVELPRSEPAKK